MPVALSDERSGTKTAVLGCSAEGSDCGENSMVRDFSIAFKCGCGSMLSTYRKVFAT